MVLHRHLSSAQELLNLAHTQAQQMLSLAYQQAQQVLACAQSQRSTPPSLVSKCKAHHRPACSLEPCSQVLYNQSKVTSTQLHAELVKNTRRPKDPMTKAQKSESRSPAQNLSLAMKSKLPVKSESCSPAQNPSLENLLPVKKSKLPRPAKHSGPIPMDEGKHPVTKPTCVIEARRTASDGAQFSLLHQTMASLNQLFTPQQKTLHATSSSSSAAVTSLVEPDVEPSSAPLFPVLASAQLSTELSSTVPSAADTSACDLAAVSIESQREVLFDADPSFTPSHLRHLNNPTFSLEGEPALLPDCFSLGSWDTAAPSSLLLEVPSVHTMQFGQEVLAAIYSGDHAAALEIFSSHLASCESQVDHTEVALLRRNCARLHLRLHQPDEALALCNLNWQVDNEDVRTERLRHLAWLASPCATIQDSDQSIVGVLKSSCYDMPSITHCDD